MPADLHDDMIDPAVANHLRHTLRRVALTTPLDGAPAPASAARPRYRRALLAVAAVATAGCVTAGLLVVSNRSSGEQQDQTPPAVAAPPTAEPGSGPLLEVDLPWQPMGIDATMKRVEEPPAFPALIEADAAAVLVGEATFYEIPGLGVQAIFESRVADNTATERCVSGRVVKITGFADNETGLTFDRLCADTKASLGSDDGASGQVRLLVLPPEVAFVTFAAGEQARWLRPVDGVAVLASTDGLGSHHLWTADGRPVAHESTPPSDIAPPPGQRLDVRSIDPASEEAQPILDVLIRSGLDQGLAFVVRPGSLRIFSVPGGGTFAAFESLFESKVIRLQCVMANSDERMCGSATGWGSSTADGEYGQQVFMWGGLGPEIAYTRFELDREPRWAPVIDGWAIIASERGRITADPALVTVDGAGFGLDEDGVQISVLADPAEYFPDGTPPDGVEETWGPAFSSTLKACVQAAGADPITGEYNGAEAADALWARCVTEAVAAWHVAIAEVAAAVEASGTTAVTLPPEVAYTEVASDATSATDASG